MTESDEQNLSNMSMADLFRQEVAAQTALLTNALLALEHQPADKKQLEILMRAAHSIKGASRIMGLDLAVKVAHELEDNFVAAQQGKITITAAQTDILLEGVDFLLKISKYPDNDIAAGVTALQPEAENLLKRLAGIKTASAAAVKTEAQPTSPPSAPPARPRWPRSCNSAAAPSASVAPATSSPATIPACSSRPLSGAGPNATWPAMPSIISCKSRAKLSSRPCRS